MKTFLNLCCAVSITCVVVFAVGRFEPASSAVEIHRTVPVENQNWLKPKLEFSAHVRSKVVQYLDTYRLGGRRGEQTGGNPPSAASEWAKGKVLSEGARAALMEAPAELAQMLPPCPPTIRYFLTGSRLVAVDADYKMVDSIWIPAVRLPEVRATEAVGDVFRLVGQDRRR